MKKLITLFFLIAIAIKLFGQMTPNWIDKNQREQNYPSKVYFTGFAYNETKNKSLHELTQQLKIDAQADLSNKIRTQIESNTQFNVAEVKKDGRYNETESFFKQSSSKSTTEVVGITTETYHDTKANLLYAFAAVKRADLVVFYQKQIDMELDNVENTLKVSEQLAAAGEKMNAHRKCEEAKKVIIDLNFYFSLLVAVNIDADNSKNLSARKDNLLLIIEQKLIDLKQSTFIYLVCKYELKGNEHDAFSSDPGIICDIIAQALSENDCSITDDINKADYELTITASTSMRSDGKGQFGVISYYANVKGTLYNRHTKKKTADFSILNDPSAYSGGSTPEVAATKAFKLPSLKNKLMETILPKIQN